MEQDGFWKARVTVGEDTFSLATQSNTEAYKEVCFSMLFEHLLGDLASKGYWFNGAVKLKTTTVGGEVNKSTWVFPEHLRVKE